jgi:hypothetical protein
VNLYYRLINACPHLIPSLPFHLIFHINHHYGPLLFSPHLVLSFRLQNQQYANRAAGSVRAALKEPLKSKLAVQGQFSYKASTWEAGDQSPKVEIDTLEKAGTV